MEKYEPLGVVGEGSYGVVLKCRCRDNGRIVAIKKFIDSEDDQNVRKIALREIRVLRKLRHENLVNLIEVFRRRKHIYLVFEFIDHTLLDQLEQKSHGLDEETCRKYIFQILRGLGFCHDNNIIHRDVKPENILVSKSGIVKLCDFGFARNLCGPGDVYTDYVATRWYRAPELLVGDVAYGKEVDIWAVGCLFAEMMTGEPLFPGDSDIDQLFLIAQCLGRLAKRHLSIMARNSAFRGFQYPKSRHGSTASTGSSKFKFSDSQQQQQAQQQQQQNRNRSGSKLSVFSIMFPSWPDEAIVFLTLCLDPEPAARPTCSTLLRLPYFTHDNFPSRFVGELNQKLQQEGRSPIKAFSKKQQQQQQQPRIANVSPSVLIPPKNIQSSHPILRNATEDTPPPLKTLQNPEPTTLSTGVSLSRQQTFVVDRQAFSNNSSNNTKVPKALVMESRIPMRKLSDDGILVTATAAPVTSSIVSVTLPTHTTNNNNNNNSNNNNNNNSTNAFSFPDTQTNNGINHQQHHQPFQQQYQSLQQHHQPLQQHHQVLQQHHQSLQQHHQPLQQHHQPLQQHHQPLQQHHQPLQQHHQPLQQHHQPLQQHHQPLQQQHSLQQQLAAHETRRFSMSKKYSEQAEDRMDMPINNNRQLPVTTLTFLGTNMFMTSNAPVPIRSPNNVNTTISTLKKTSPKKANFFSQSTNKPIAFGTSISSKESFLPRMKIVDDANSTFPFLTLGSPTKPGTSSLKKRGGGGDNSKWEPTPLTRKPSTTGLHEKTIAERPEAPSPKNTLPFM